MQRAQKPEPPPEEPEGKPAREKPAPVPAAATNFEPLRVFEPEKTQAESKSIEPPAPTTTPDESKRLKSLAREVRRAMKKLEDGNAVAAYQILREIHFAKVTPGQRSSPLPAIQPFLSHAQKAHP